MTLPPLVTNTTPLSKTLALFILIAFTIAGFYFGTRYERSRATQLEPRLQIFDTQYACEAFVERRCVPLPCEEDINHPSCSVNPQFGWYATKDSITNPSTDESRCTAAGGRWVDEYRECEHITREVCTSFNGLYVSCASPCRHLSGGDFCAEVCVEVCTL